jgi:hypothetical protein
MSEADTPKTRSSEEGWATVEFPRTMAIEKLVRSQTEPDPPDDPQDFASAMALVQQLRQREEQLGQRIRDLEATVEQMKSAQLAPSAEPEKSNHSNVRAPENRQQLLVDTIRKKLDAYQQRIAQMEEEHAQTQQRYQEKTYQLQQVEHTCQELRSRLHRQQRHALQFKAALEKCLEAEAQQRSTPSNDHSSTQFLFSTPPSTPPASFSLPPQDSDLTDADQPFLSLGLEESQGEPEWSPVTDLSAHESALDADAFQNPSSSRIYPENVDTDTGSDAPSDADPNSTSLTKRQSISNLDLPSFPRLS